MNNLFDEIKEEILERENNLSKNACKSRDAILLKKDSRMKTNELRTIFSKDADRIIHSMSYTRYIDKTQVYSFIENDHITHRVLHVQLVSKIARTMGKILNLNQDLIEAIALGHDVGHTPFGHMGEYILNEICIKENIGYFKHNAQSVRTLKDIEQINLTLQTLDGILAHNGELLQSKYKPEPKTSEQFLEELHQAFYNEDTSQKIIPMTMEGCVVRISDIIAYIGRDIEDAMIVGSIQREELPPQITQVLGNNNSEIVDKLIKDIIQNSYGKDYLCFSKEVFNSLMNLKQWNYEHIYCSKEASKNKEIIKQYFHKLFYKYLDYLDQNNQEVNPSKQRLYAFWKERSKEYKDNTSNKRMIVDYIAGQTDHYFLRECECNFPEFHKEKLYQ